MCVFPHRVGHCALLAPFVSVKPQKFVKLTHTPLIFLGFQYLWECISYVRTLTHLNIFELEMSLENCHGMCSRSLPALKTLTSLNKEVRPFFLSDNSIWSLPSVSSLSDYSISRS